MRSKKFLLKESTQYSNLEFSGTKPEDIDATFLGYVNQGAKNASVTMTISSTKDKNKVWINKVVDNYGKDLPIDNTTESKIQPFTTYLKNYTVKIDPTQKIIYVESSAVSTDNSSKKTETNLTTNVTTTKTSANTSAAKNAAYGFLKPFIPTMKNPFSGENKPEEDKTVKEEINRMKNLMNL